MASPAPSLSSRTLDAALDVETRRLEILIARISQLLYAGAFLAGALMSVATARPFGLLLALASLAYLGWYTLIGRAFARGDASERMRLAGEVVSATVPWVFFAALALAEGGGYALASWIPPMLFCALMMGGIVRLRPLLPLVFGATGAVVFPALYFALVRARLTPVEAASVVNGPWMQLLRGGLMALAGGAGALATAGLRGVMGRAESAVREHDLFGKYRLIRRVGHGGMGTVWEALYCPEGGFSRKVAVKQIHEHLAVEPSFVDAFRAEAALSAKLLHPNLVQVMDFGRQGASYFLAMEFVDGATLSALAASLAARGEHVPREVAAFVLLEILAGLEHAHEGARDDDGRPLCVVHRDLCPQNVLLSRSGEVKIADFGVARALGDARAAATRTMGGHVGYASPEQARGGRIDARADLFAAGVVLWELLAGRALFQHDNEVTTLMAVVSGHVDPPSALRADVDAAWDSVVLRALARDPAARFASARQMSEAIRELPGAIHERAREALAELVEGTRGPTTRAHDDDATVVDDAALTA